jgi:hypothetical protein
MSADEAPTVMDTGISKETHDRVSTELADAQRQLAMLRAKTDMYDAQKREALTGMKDEVAGFINDIHGSEEFAAYKHELAPMARWCGEMEKGDALETNLSIGRLISCASAKFKRTREEASQLGEKSTALASAYKELEEMKADRDLKASRIGELETMVDERTNAAKAFEAELAKNGMIKEKIDFSQKSARENVEPAGGSSSKAPMVNMDDALLGFINSGGGGGGGARIMQSATGHGHLGSTGGDIYSAALAM